MQEETMGLIEAALRTDRTIGQTDRQRLVGLMRNRMDQVAPTLPDRILRRAEAAMLLGRSPKTLDRLVERGGVRKVSFPGYRRAAGFRLSDIARLIAGGDDARNNGGDEACH